MYSDRLKTIVDCVALGTLAACLFAAPAVGQEQTAALDRGAKLAPTVDTTWPAPQSNKVEIQCGILLWEPDAGKPTLTLVCPPAGVFAPLRVYMRLSSDKPEQARLDYRKVVAPQGAQTKLRSIPGAALVWLRIAEKENREPKAKWVSFDYLMGVALQADTASHTARK